MVCEQVTIGKFCSLCIDVQGLPLMRPRHSCGWGGINLYFHEDKTAVLRWNVGRSDVTDHRNENTGKNSYMAPFRAAVLEANCRCVGWNDGMPRRRVTLYPPVVTSCGLAGFVAFCVYSIMAL